MISIHAPVWGRAKKSRRGCCSITHFNSRPRVGAGASVTNTLLTNENFNSRPRVGAGIATSCPARPLGTFQFTPPCGGGPLVCLFGFVHHMYDFNSRPRVGAGPAPYWSRFAGRNFNSRPRVGAGPGALHAHRSLIMISIHAPVWGRAKKAISQREPVTYFNSRPRVGRAWLAVWYNGARTFQFTPPVWGRAGRWYWHGGQLIDFNSRPRVGAGTN